MRTTTARLALLCCAASSLIMAAEAGIERHDPRLDAIIAPDATIEVLGSGYGWAEGPVWDAAQQRLLFSSVPKNRVHVWTEADGVEVFLEPSGHTGFGEPPNPKQDGSNGLALDEQGRLLLCQHGDRRVARLEADGSFTTLASHYQDNRLNSPNDLAIGPGGAVYFTDPTFGLKGNKKSEQRELDHAGVYRIDPDGPLHLLIDDLFPNGIAFSPSRDRCYVTDGKRLMVYEVADDGALVAGSVFATLEEDGAWDGLAVDAAGNLFACNWKSGVFVYAPDGSRLGTIRTGNHNANCCFGGADGRTLFITAGNALMRLPVAIGRPTME